MSKNADDLNVIGVLILVGTNWQFVLQGFVAQIANLRFCITALLAT
jgi:hypothetical protein